jgi:hypothetical protein
MRVSSPLALLGIGAALAVGGCKSPVHESRSDAASVQSALAALAPARPARPISSEIVELERSLQASQFNVAPRTYDGPLAFGKGIFGQLTESAFRSFDTDGFRPLGSEPLDGPRALVTLADGALLAVGATTLLRWEPGQKRPTRLPKPMLLPQARLFADAQQPDQIWVFDAGGPSTELSKYQLPGRAREPAAPQNVLLPETTVTFGLPRLGAFGATREGVWLYVSPTEAGKAGAPLRVERLSPGGLRLPGLQLPQRPRPTWVLPARRLDQSVWVEATGRATRVLVSPTYKELQVVPLAGRAVAAASGNEGRLVAVVEVTGPGPKFELELLDQDLAPIARVALAADAPTGSEGWERVVTENQAVAVAAREPMVAVGGPARVTIFDGQGHQLFSIPSK